MDVFIREKRREAYLSIKAKAKGGREAKVLARKYPSKILQ